jgi:hypothetical protein
MSDYRRNLAWRAGHKAALANKTLAANNRQEGTIFYDDWCDGHNDALNALAVTPTPSSPQGEGEDA